MSVRLRILSSVFEDIADAFLYYEDQRKGLGDRLLQSIDALYANVSDFPMMYPVRFDDVHRAILSPFPYAVYYTYENEEVTIIAFRNTKQVDA